MSTSAADSWGRVRQTFADQFEQDGANFIYRRSQKGEAIRVSAEERSKFIEEFDRNVRRAKWIIYVGLTLVLGGIIGFSLLRGTDLSQGAIFIGIGLVMIPYFAFYRWAWAAPARELGGRTPIAGERPSDEVRRMRFRRVTYGQLASAAFGGVMIPFIGSSRQDVFSGWNRLWLVFGGALVLFAAVQAFRKWRFEQEDSYSNVIPPSPSVELTEPAQEPTAPLTSKVWRYVPLAVILLGVAFIAYTSAGRQLAKQPSFWPILMIAFGCWSLITVARGFAKGQIEPFARGFYNTYQRETQPKRFWASMTWNGIFGCLCFWIAFMMSRDATAQPLQDRCYNEGRKYQPQDVLLACNQLLAGKASLGGWSRADVFVDRGIAYDDLGRPQAAIADYTTAISLQSKYPEAYYDRALAYERIGDVPHALDDYGSAIQQNPKDPDFFFHRGLVYLNMRRWDAAIGDFTRSHNLDPKNAWPLANRGLAYAWKSDAAHAKQDFAAVRAIDPQNRVMLHGEGLMYMYGGDLDAAVDRFSTAISNDPSDAWSLQMRADAYQQMGEFDKARADRGRLLQLSKATREPAASS
jgi:tetratricopeptide (TPR) repeat protein